MRALILLLTASVAGCGMVPVRVTYIPVPAGYLEPCDLPPVGDYNTDLADGFVQAYQCAEIGNRDKERIRAWQDEIDKRTRK